MRLRRRRKPSLSAWLRANSDCIAHVESRPPAHLSDVQPEAPLPCEDGGRHQSRAPITAKLHTALSQNGAAMPNPPITTPPSAGPIALLMLTPTPLLATAAAKSCFGTS